MNAFEVKIIGGSSMASTLSRETTDAVQHFKAKLEFESNPYSVKDHIQKNDPVKVIDLRDPESYAKGHVPGSVNVQYDDLGKHLSQLKKDETTIVYCYNITCALATRAALYLAEQGYKVKEMIGGYQEWQTAGFANETKSASSCSTTKGSSCS
jgi:rhodanese-related sulfurtransferase